MSASARVLLCTAVACIATTYSHAANEVAEEYARLALDSALNGDLSDAAILASHALRCDPGDADVQMAVGVLHWTRTAQLSASLQAAPTSSPASKAALQQYTHHAIRAVTAFKRSIAANPWDSAAADALEGVVRGVAKQGAVASSTAVHLSSILRMADYAGGPTRHARHRMPYEPHADDVRAATNADAYLPPLPVLQGPPLLDAKVLWELGYKQKAVRLLCTNDGVRVTVPEHERNISTGAMPPDLSLDLATILQVCGFVVVQGAMPVDFVRFLREKNNVSTKNNVALHATGTYCVQEYFSSFIAREAATQANIETVEHLYGYVPPLSPLNPFARPSYTEFTRREDYTVRSAGRYEYRLPLRNEFARDELLSNPWVRPGLARAMDANELVVDMLSAITSLPGSPTQHLHKDVGPLYSTDGATPWLQQNVFRRLRSVLGPPPGDPARLAAHMEHFQDAFFPDQFVNLGQTAPSPAPPPPAAVLAEQRARLANVTTVPGAKHAEYADAARFPVWHPWELTPDQYIAAMTHSEHGFWDGGHTPPPFSVAMVTPLVNMTLETGPTTFIPGSHAFAPSELSTEDTVFDAEAEGSGDAQWQTVNRSPLQRRSFLYGETQEGDVILFDVRVTHRGGSNRQKGPHDWRSILYCTFTHDWFHDGRNFQPRHTSQFDAFPPYVRTAVTRIDQHDYLRQVETELANAFVDVVGMSSTYEFDTTQYADVLPLRDTAVQRAGQLLPGTLPRPALLAALRELHAKHTWHSSAQPQEGEQG